MQRTARLSLGTGLGIGAVSLALVLAPGTGMAASAATHGTGGNRIAPRSIHMASGVSAASSPKVQVVASGLNNPRKIAIGPDGSLYVTEAGINTSPQGCNQGTENACANPSGAIARVSTAGKVQTVVSGLPSINNGGDSPGVSGPSGIYIAQGHIQFLTQNANIDSTTGDETYGPGGKLLGDLLSSPLSGGNATTVSVEAEMGPYEAAHNPDHGADATQEPTIDSDPYSVTAFDGGYAIADAAANDVLLYKNGKLSLLAVLPLVKENGGTAQPVPTSLVVGPDGDLYIGELGGVENGNDVGVASVYKLVGTKLVTVASGFTTIGDIAFDQAGRLLVLEMDQDGLEDSNAVPAPGELIRINHDGSRTVLASQGLEYPAGMAVAKDGSVYLTNWSVIQGQNDPNVPPGSGISGEVVRVSDTSPADQIGANYGGYREVASDGGVFTFGSYGFYGSLGAIKLNKPVVGGVQSPLGPGYWMVASDGGVFNFGTAGFYGSAGDLTLNKPVTTIAPTPDGKGYYLFASDGGVFTYGDAVFHGSLGDHPLTAPIVAATVTPDGGGYWLFAADGGVFALGDATFYGSMGATKLNQPVVSGAATSDGRGYYLFAADGGLFTFGDAAYHGSMGGTRLNQPVVSGTVTPDNGGYRMAASDGGIFDFGDAQFYGSEGGKPLNQPIVSLG